MITTTSPRSRSTAPESPPLRPSLPAPSPSLYPSVDASRDASASAPAVSSEAALVLEFLCRWSCCCLVTSPSGRLLRCESGI